MVRRLLTSQRRYKGERGGVPWRLHAIGIDLGKTVFHLVGLNQRGEVVVRKKFSRTQLLRFTANLQVASDWHGSLRRISFPRPGASRAGS